MAAPQLKPVPTAPEALRQRPQWVLWRYEERDGKMTKVPYNPRAAEKRASTTTPGTWGTYAQVTGRFQREPWDGIGYVFSADDPYVGIDLDHCIDSDGDVTPAALHVVTELNTYTEVSPSGTGLHILAEATLPRGRRVAHNLGIEMYGEGRFFTITGRRWADTSSTINHRHDALQALHKTFFGESVERPAPRPAMPTSFDDREVIDRASGDVNGQRFYNLWRGDWSAYATQSEADLALCNLLAFYSHDEVQTDRLFRQSGLYRDKWDKQHYADGHTYGEQTIRVAFAGRTEFYQPARRKEPAAPTRPDVDAPTPDAGDESPQVSVGRFHFLSDIQVQDLPPLRWIVDKILPEGCLTTIYGEPWAGKSFVALDISAHVAEGIAWNGRKVTAGHVVYIAAEGMRGMQLRIKAWKLARHIPLDYSIPIHFLGVPVSLLSAEDIGELMAAIRKLPEPPKLIVFDTLGRSFVGGEENSNDDMNRACNAANCLQQEFGCNVIFVHHKGKNNPTMRGASALLGGVDTAIEVTKDEGSPLVTLTCKKQKDGAEPFPSIGMRLKPLLVDENGDLSSCVLVPADASTRLAEIQGPHRTAFIVLASEFVHAEGATSNDWYAATKLPRQTFYDARNWLMEHDYVINPQPGRNSRHKLSAKGIDIFTETQRNLTNNDLLS